MYRWAVSSMSSVALVTGAGSGIGEATARRLVSQGWQVVAAGRRAERLVALQQSLGENVAVRPADMGDSAAVTTLVGEVVESFGRLDAVVNNAGNAAQLSIAETNPQFFAEAIGVNLLGPAAAISAAWPHFLRQGNGCIVNVSSLAQFDPFPGFFAYAASKAGLHMLTVVAHNEGAAAGVRAFTVAPGVVDTELHHRLMPEGVDAAFRHEPDDIARVIVECLAGDHDALAGRTLAVVTPQVATFVQTWIDAHVGGGITIVER